MPINMQINKLKCSKFGSLISLRKMKSSDPETVSARYSFIHWLIQVIFVWCFIISVIWLTVTPKHPVYKVTDVYISPVFLNSTSRQQVVTAIILSIEISNGNEKIGFVYDEAYLALYNADIGIGSGNLSGFYQEKRNRTTEREVRVDVEEQKYVRGILGRRFDMKVCLETKVQYTILDFTTKHHQMSYEAVIQIGEDGRMIGEDVKLYLDRHRKSCFIVHET